MQRNFRFTSAPGLPDRAHDGITWVHDRATAWIVGGRHASGVFHGNETSEHAGDDGWVLRSYVSLLGGIRVDGKKMQGARASGESGDTRGILGMSMAGIKQQRR